MLLNACEIKEDENEKQKVKGTLTISFANLSKENQFKSTSEESVPKSLIISIKNLQGEYVFNAHKMDLFKLGDGYFTENLEFEVGEYTVVDFLVLDSNDSTIYLTPKLGSEYEKLVSTPLPFVFSVSEEEITDVVLDVISSNLGSADKYGYATFSFNILNILVLQPGPISGKDAVFGKAVPNNNYGDIQDIHLYGWTHGGMLVLNRVAIDFDLSVLPENAIIDSALISLYFNASSPYLTTIGYEGHYGDNGFTIERIIEEWDEKSITWSNQPGTTEEYKVFIEDSSDPTKDYLDIGITQIVVDSYKNLNNSFGFMLKHTEEEAFKVTYFASSDHEDKSIRPKLKIFYH